MPRALDQTPPLQKYGKRKQYGSEFEKQLMMENLRTAVEIYGKERLRRGFKIRKK